jgi:transcriptional regulator with XRE-family HTH domain
MSKAQTLREMRIDKRLTQQDVAKKAKVSPSYYSQVERGLKPSETAEMMLAVNRMKGTKNRTSGGTVRAGRDK